MRSVSRAIAALVCVVGASAFGANGSHLIGISPVSAAMGGTGVGNYSNDLDAIYKNPAFLGNRPVTENTRLSTEVAGSFFKISPSADTSGAGLTASSNGVKLAPSIAVAYQYSDNFSFGIAGITYGGGVADYTSVAALSQIKAQSSFIRIMPTAAYRINDWLTVGASPFLVYGSLETNEALLGGAQSTRAASTKFGYGAHLGIGMKASEQVNFGVAFTTKSDLNHDNLMNFTLLGAAPNPAAAPTGMKVQSPMEGAVGMSYRPADNWIVTTDLRYIAWSGSAGHKELGWKDQFVIALGGQHNIDKLSLRAGFNWAPAPIRSTAGENGEALVDFQGTQIKTYNQSKLNLVAFPALGQTHFTLGSGFSFTEDFGVDLALMYSPRVTITRSGTSTTAVAAGGPGVGTYTFTGTATQWSVSVGATYKL